MRDRDGHAVTVPFAYAVLVTGTGSSTVLPPCPRDPKYADAGTGTTGPVWRPDTYFAEAAKAAAASRTTPAVTITARRACSQS